MTEFNTTINVDSQGIQDFVDGLNQVEREIKVIEKELRSLGIPEKQLTNQAKRYREQWVRNQKAISLVQKQIADEASDLQKKRFDSLNELGRETLAVFIGGSIGEVLSGIVNRVGAVVEENKEVNKAAATTAQSLETIGKAIDNIILGLLAVVEPFIGAIGTLIEKSGLAAEQLSKTAQSIQQASKALSDIRIEDSSLQTLEEDLELRQEQLKTARETQTVDIQRSETLKNQAAIVKDQNIDFQERLKLYQALQEENSEIFRTSVDQIKNEEQLNTALNEGLEVNRQKLILNNKEQEAAQLRLQLAILLNRIQEGQNTLSATQLESLNIQAESLQSQIRIKEESILFTKGEIVEQEKKDKIIAGQNKKLEKQVTLLEALQAEQEVIQSEADEQQDIFDFSIDNGNFTDASKAFDELSKILKDLEDNIKSIESEVSKAGEISSEVLDQARKDFEATSKSVTSIGTQFSSVVNDFINSAPNLTNRNPLKLALQDLVTSGQASQEFVDSFLKSFTDQGGLINVFNTTATAVTDIDDELLEFIKSIGVSGPLLTQLSEDGVKAFSVLFEQFKQSQFDLDEAQKKFDNRSNKVRKEEAEREAELIKLRLQRDAILKQVEGNQEKLDNFTIERLIKIRDAAEESAKSIFRLLLNLNDLTAEDVLFDFDTRRSTALDEVLERGLVAIDDFNKVLEASGESARLNIQLNEDTGRAFVEGLTQGVKDAQPELVQQLELIVREYNLILQTFEQESENLPLIVADLIANSVRNINRFILRDIKLDLEVNDRDLQDAVDKLREDIEKSLTGRNLGIFNTRRENEAIRKAGEDAIAIEKESFKLRQQQIDLFYTDAINSAEQAGQDTTLLVKERQNAVEKLEREHSDKVQEINDETNEGIKQNNQLTLDSIVEISTSILENTSDVFASVLNFQDQLTENALNNFKESIAEIDKDLSETTNNINSLEADLEGKREGRREALLRGLEIEREQEEALTKKKIEQERLLEEAEREANERRKEAAIAQALINAAVAVTGTWAGYASFGAAGPVLAGIQTAAIAATTAFEIATIEAQQFEFGGVLNGPSHNQGGIPFTVGGVPGFEAEGGEAIINKRSTQMFRPLLSAINEAGGGKKFQNGAVLGADLNTVSQALNGVTRSDIMQIAERPIYANITEISNLQARQVQVTDRSSI